MRVPSTDVSERSLNAEVRLEQLSDLLHVVAEFVVGIFDAGSRRVLRRVGVVQHLNRLKSFFASRMEDCVSALTIHFFESVGCRRRIGTAAAHGKAVHARECDGWNLTSKSARYLRSECQRAKRGVLLAMAKIFLLQGAVQPAILCAFDPRRAGLHEVLGVAVGTGHVWRAGGMDDSKMALIIERFESRERRMKAKESVKIEDLIFRNGDAGPHCVVILLAVRDDDIETIRGSALEDDYEAAAGGRRNIGKH